MDSRRTVSELLTRCSRGSRELGLVSSDRLSQLSVWAHVRIDVDVLVLI